MHPRRALGAACVAVLAVSPFLAGCTEDPNDDPGRTGVGDAVEVKFSGGDEMQTFDEVPQGRGASFPLPNVCARTDQPVRITGVELQAPDPGLSVTGYLVADEPGAPGAIVSKPLDQTPQSRHAAPEGLITTTCESEQSVQVWVEVTLDRQGSAQALAVRYRYQVEGEVEELTNWFPSGVGLSTEVAPAP